MVPELPKEPQLEPDLEYITVLETANPAILAVAKSLLESAEIEYLTFGEELQDIIGLGRLGFGNPIVGPVRIRVRREDEAEAKEILRDLSENPPRAEFPDTAEPAETPPEASQAAQPFPTDISGRPWRRQLTLIAQAVVIVIVAVGLIETHRTGIAGWWYGYLAVRCVERSLDLETAFEAQPAAFQRVVRLWMSSPVDPAAWAVPVYEKALNFLDRYDHPEPQSQAVGVRARLAVTLAEFGHREAAAESLRALISRAPPNANIGPLVARISQAYVLGVSPPASDAPSEELLPGWSADVVDARLAQARGDLLAAAAARERISARGGELLPWALGTVAIGLVLTFGGLLALPLLFFRRPALPPLRTPWTLAAGLWTVALAYFWTFVGEYALRFTEAPREAFLVVWALIILPLPWFVLVRRRLLRPAGINARVAFGVDGWIHRAGALVLWVFGSSFDVAVLSSAAVLVGPVVEEVAFRGILYASLRNRLPPLSAAVLSSAAFAATHPYGLASLATVAWTGFVLCLAYERSRSLVPAIIAHSLVNAGWVFSAVAIFR